MIPEIMAAAFIALGLLYVLLRISGYFSRIEEHTEIKPTASGKLYHSKVNDMAFFDGASEDYAEALNRMKQFGGA